jgi:trans-2-enoyl-CoA reductase
VSEEQAKRIVDAIISDLTDRRGLRQEWEEIDSDIQNEIREAWTRIVMERGAE